MTDEYELAIAETYRGVELYAGQSAERIAEAKRQIDSVVRMSSPRTLDAFACDGTRAPEARLLAKNKALAAIEQRQRKPIDVEHLEACTIGIERVSSELGRLIVARQAGGVAAGWPEAWMPKTRNQR